MRAALRIGRRLVGENFPAFVIAEIGCNHENDFERACQMVVRAGEAGADAAKFQTFDPETLVTRDAPKFWEIPGPGQTQYEEFFEARPRFTVEQYRRLLFLAEQRDIVFFSTPTDEALIDFLDGLGVPAFKIASMDITHLPLLRHVAGKGKPVILSTGTATIAEVREAVEVLREAGAGGIGLLHCISSYPTPPASVNLGMMRHLQQEFPECVVGYSDHTLPTLPLAVPVLAVAAGAKIIEKHFTFDQTRPGYDHEISADYSGLKRLVDEIRYVEQILGQGTKAPVEVEAGARRFGRRSLVAAVDIPAGEVIRRDMIAVKRPGTGIEPKALETVVGRVARRRIACDEVLTWDAVR